MPDAATAVGPLADRPGLDTPALALTVLPRAARFGVRCPTAAAAARAGLAKIGLVLPDVAHAVAMFDEGGRVCWLAPDEWLVVAPAHLHDAMAGWFAEAFAPAGDGAGDRASAAAADLSDATVTVRLAGPAATDVLAAGCPLDLHARAFPVGTCRRSRLAKVGVLLYRGAEASFDVDVSRSVARYAYDWLVAAAREFTGPAGG